jgi:hypothetical protein
MRIGRAGWLGFAGAGALASACAGAPTATTTGPATTTAPPEIAAPAWPSPARWDYHPAAPDNVRAHARLADGGCVIAADDGQRWLVTPPRGDDPRRVGKSGTPPRACAGRAEAADVLAPEELVGVVRRSATAWVFVGASGTLYEAADPLGAFVRTVPSPEPLARVGGSGGALVAATLDGRLLRWEEATGWRAGPNVGARLFDLAFAEAGRGLALALPEALFTTEDGGATWTRAGATVTPIGARRVGLTAAGKLAVDGFMASLVWSPRERVPFEKSADASLAAPAASDLDVGKGAAASAIAAGRAAIDGERYLEAIRPDDEGDAWQLGRGRLDGRLELAPIAGSDGCGALKIGANGRHVVVVCSRASGDDVDALVLRSEDAGATFAEAARLATDTIDHVAVAVAPDGAALVTGTCKAAEKSGCRPMAPMLVRPEGKTSSAMVAAATQLGATALAPAFSIDGRSAYFLGVRAKDSRTALFVSHDGGESFSPRPLEAPSAAPRVEGVDDDDGEREGNLDLDDAVVVRPGEDGTVGARVTRSRGAAWVTTDDDGRVIAVSGGPTETAVISGFGRRVLAVSPEESRPGAGASAWESLDGGATWAEIAAPRALARELTQGPGVVACGGGGCLVGDTVARVGWSGQAETIAEPPPSPDGGGRGEPVAKTPIVCDLGAQGWTRIEGVVGSGRTPLPDENEAARGRSVWSVLTHDRATGAVAVVTAIAPESGDGEARVVTRRLLGPAPKASPFALEIAPQMEGYAAVRVKLPLDDKGKLRVGAPMAGVEVAWENFMDGTSARATIADAGPFEAGDIRTRDGATELEAGLVSVSLRGIFVRPHARATAAASTAFFIDPQGKAERFEYPPWPSAAVDGRHFELVVDAAVADGQLLGVARARAVGDEPRTVLLGKPPPRGGGSHAWELTATTVAPPATGPLVVADEWTYVGASLGFTTLVADATHERAWGTFHPFRGDGTFGAPIAVPTQLDLPDRPRGCSASERGTTARMEAPLAQGGQLLFVGTRHPVIVGEALAATPSAPRKAARAAAAPKLVKAAATPATGDAFVLLTSSAVVHGTPASPCLAAWQATGVGRAPVSAVIPSDLAHAWLFRVAASEPAAPHAGKPKRDAASRAAERGPAIEVRPMACHFDPSARVPETIWGEPGTLRPPP